MELADFVGALKKHLRASLLLSLIVSVVVFVGSFYIPIKYKASATLFVNREVESLDSVSVRPNYFTYEGFYAIQTAEKYTDTVIGLLRSENIEKLVEGYLKAESSKTEVYFRESDFKLFKGSLVVKRVGPQIIAVSVMGRDPLRARSMWSALAKTVIVESAKLNSAGDNKLSIEAVGDGPVVAQMGRHPFINAVVAFLLSMLVGVLFLAFKEYLED